VSERERLSDEQCALIAARELQISHWKFRHPTDMVKVTLGEIVRAIRAGYDAAALENCRTIVEKQPQAVDSKDSS
jgi:hypothetical protein